MTTHEFIPARSTHAITGAAFACEMAVPVSTDIVSSLIASYDADEEVKRILPAKGEERGFTIEIGHQAAQVEQPGGLVGARFERFSPDGTLEWSLSLRGNLLLVACNAYTRWSEIFPQASELLRWGLRSVSPFGIGVVAIGLQYQDEFLWSGDLATMDPAALFHSETDLLPAHFLSKKGLWHNYSGWFEEASEPVPGRRLINMNVAFIQKAEKGVVQLVSSHKGIFPDTGDAPSDPSNLLDALHTEHKELLAKLLSDPVQRKIKLDQ